MIRLQWKERLRIGHPEIDRQHQGLVALINQLIDLLNQSATPATAAPLVRQLAEYAMNHFRLEETYMVRCGFTGLPEHKSEHERFVRQVLGFNRDTREISHDLLQEMLSFLSGWLVRHVYSMDREYAPCVLAYGRKAQPRAVVFTASFLGALDFARLAAGLQPHGAQPADALERALKLQGPLFADWETGRKSDDEAIAAIAAACGIAMDAAKFLEACRAATVPRDDLLPLLRELKPRVRLGLVADAGPGLVAAVLAPLPGFALFDACCASFETGASHSAPVTLAGVCRKLGVLAEETVYVDDDLSAREAAASERMRAIPGGGADALADALREAGVTVKA